MGNTRHKSGQEKRIARRERDAAARARHEAELAAAGSIEMPPVPESCGDPLRAHLWQLTQLLELQDRLNRAPRIGEGSLPLERLIGLSTTIGNTISKLRVDAELTKKADENERLMNEAREALEKERSAMAKERRSRGLSTRLYQAVESRARKDKVTPDDIIARALEGYCAAELKEVNS